ncbi:DNA-binding transcriptional repressor AcrR [Brucella anthropi]|nr:helix-turn-helix domain-containing protein [Brucella anthropi]SUB56177.1 DNA-binding transcriptional repressor AcrR [Brucella anthropi]
MTQKLTGVKIVDDNKAKRRGRGRPPARSAEETAGVIVEAAITEFLTSGYAQTSVEAVARRAGISTRTLYRLVENKAALFRMAAESRIEASLASPDTAGTAQSGVEEQLAQIVLVMRGCFLARKRPGQPGWSWPKWINSRKSGPAIGKWPLRCPIRSKRT